LLLLEPVGSVYIALACLAVTHVELGAKAFRGLDNLRFTLWLGRIALQHMLEPGGPILETVRRVAVTRTANFIAVLARRIVNLLCAYAYHG
jgi:hypothetical protein